MQDVIESSYAGLNRRERLELLHKQASALKRRHEILTGPINGTTGPGQFAGATERSSLNGALTAHFDAILQSTEADLEKIGKKEAEARDVSGRARETNNGLRIITSQNWMVPSLLFTAMFFDTITLQPDEQALYQKRTKGEVPIYTYGKNGKPKRLTLTDSDFYSNGTPLPVKFLTSARVEYPLMDVNRGSIRESALETFDLAVDMAAKVDLEGKTIADAGAYGNFTLSGARVNRLINAHSRVVTANFPTTNLVAAGNNPKLLDILADVKQYCSAWGTGAWKDGDLMPTGRILIPSGDVKRIWGLSDFSTVSAAKSQLGEKVQAEGWTSFHYLGTDWVLVPDNTLASGSLYVQLNKPVGTLFLKPAFDREIVKVDEDAGPLGGDLESRYLKKPVWFVVPDDRKANGYKVTYTFS